jgi:hypothetical protein
MNTASVLCKVSTHPSVPIFPTMLVEKLDRYSALHLAFGSFLVLDSHVRLPPPLTKLAATRAGPVCTLACISFTTSMCCQKLFIFPIYLDTLLVKAAAANLEDLGGIIR